MDQDFSHLKSKVPPSTLYEEDNELVNFMSVAQGIPCIARVSVKQYPAYKTRITADGKEEQIEHVKSTPVWLASGNDKRDFQFSKPHVIVLKSLHMDEEFVKWDWTLDSFIEAYEQQRLRFTKAEDIVKQVYEQLSKTSTKITKLTKKDKMEMKYQMIVDMYKQGRQKKDIMRDLDVTRRQVDHTLQRYFETGNTCILKSGPKEKFNNLHYEWVKQCMYEHHGELELPQLKRLFDTHFQKEGTTISVCTLFKMLERAKIKMVTRKVLKEMKQDQDDIDKIADERKEKAELVLQLLADPAILTIFYDEITFSSFDGPDRVYSFEGMPVQHKYTPKERFRVVAIVAMLETGEVYYSLHDRATDTETVICFVTRLLEDIGGKGYPSIAFFGDNASWHSDKRIQTHLPPGVFWFKNTPSSPQLNPIEVLFANVKRKFRMDNYKKDFQEMTRSASIALEASSLVQVKGAIRNTLHYLLRAYRQLPIFVDTETVLKDEKAFFDDYYSEE